MSYNAIAPSDIDAIPLGTPQGPKPTILSVQVEKIRLVAYLAFWGMCGFAIIVANITVFPYMTCVIDGVDKVGTECTDLFRIFGFNNICANWDYSPSTQLTGMVYPIFEYALLLYILLDYYQVKNDMLNGIFPQDKSTLMTVMFWIKIVLVAWFRMIFICKVTDDAFVIGGLTVDPVVAHTLGFWGLQFGLVLIAFENVLYLTYREQGMWSFSPSATVKLGYVYIVLLAGFTAVKVVWSGSIFASPTGEPIIPNSVAKYFDKGWMLLAAILPVFFALNGMKKDPPMIISIVNSEERK